MRCQDLDTSVGRIVDQVPLVPTVHANETLDQVWKVMVATSLQEASACTCYSSVHASACALARVYVLVSLCLLLAGILHAYELNRMRAMIISMSMIAHTCGLWRVCIFSCDLAHV